MGKKSREKKQNFTPEVKPNFQRRTAWEKICILVINWGAYLVLFTPVVINIKFFFPFVAPKTVFFRILVEIIFAAYLFLVIKNKRYRPRLNALTIALTLFVAIFILASFTGVNLERSFWSTNERMTGILTMLHLFAFFIVLSGVFREKKDWERVLGVSVLVGVILSLYILLGSQVSTRGGGTIGNTSFMAAYLLFDVFFAIILVSVKRGWWQILAGISLLIMTPVLLNSTGRGAIAAFLLGLFLLGLGYLAFSQRSVLKKTALCIILVLAVLGVTLAIFQPPFIKHEAERTLVEMNSRFVVWGGGWKGFLERPILGWGPENFNVVFLKYFNPCMSLSECGNEIWFDRVHNIVLDTLVTTGAVGFLSYLAIFAAAIYGLLRIIPRIVERKNVFFPLGLAVLLIIYFIQNLLVFDMINTYLVFFLSLGCINFLTEKGKEELPEPSRSINPVLGSVIVAATAFSLWQFNVQPMIANHYVIRVAGASDVGAATSFFEKSLGSWMNKYETREHFTQKITNAAYQNIPENQRVNFQKAVELIESEMEKSIEENPLDFRHHLFLGQLYNGAYRFNGNPGELQRAEDVLKKAISLSPTNQQGYWFLAEVKVAQGRHEEALSLLKKAVALEPRIGQAHWYLAMIYKIKGDNLSAKEELVAMQENGYKWEDDVNQVKNAIEIYNALGDDAGLIHLYLKVIEKEPENAQVWAALAASYANVGDFAKAKEAAQEVIELDPDLAPSVKKFLKNLPQ